MKLVVPRHLTSWDVSMAGTVSDIWVGFDNRYIKNSEGNRKLHMLSDFDTVTFLTPSILK